MTLQDGRYVATYACMAYFNMRMGPPTWILGQFLVFFLRILVE